MLGLKCRDQELELNQCISANSHFRLQMQRLAIRTLKGSKGGNGLKSLDEVKKCEGAEISHARELNPDNTRKKPYCNETILLKLNLEM